MIVEQDYWDKSYKKLRLSAAQETDPTSKFLDKFLLPVKDKKMIEIGCFPGRYLPIISKKGYLINGIDVYHHTSLLLNSWMDRLGIETGKFIVDDFNQHEFSDDFDLVCSFGFVEHFKNYSDVISKHSELVAPGGLLIITAPNFSGWLQRVLHFVMDRENYLRHNIDSMNLDSWESIIKTRGFETIFKGYYGIFDFWVDHSKENTLLNFFTRMIRRTLIPVFRLINKDMKFSSPYMAIVAIRK